MPYIVSQLGGKPLETKAHIIQTNYNCVLIIILKKNDLRTVFIFVYYYSTFYFVVHFGFEILKWTFTQGVLYILQYSQTVTLLYMYIN